ncbi:MAG: prephenate dehydrogenase [Clostridia bacterium]|nr:prephenate dehydrogenase [Clostridia bacterium]
MWTKDTQVLIVGLGLMGGSYARALKKQGFHVTAITRSQSSIDYALAEGFIDRGYTEVSEESVSSADAVIFSLYPGALLPWIEAHQHLFKPGVKITDVTGVKTCVVYDIQRILRKDVEFIGAHPMAGKETSGVESSDERIFAKANYIVVPTEQNTAEGIAWCKELGTLLGVRKISELSPEEHDEMIGFVSQLTHCIAVCLMTCKDNEHLVDYTGDSFHDLTRIARINDRMWSELFLLNREALLEQMDLFMEEFKDLRAMLEAGDVDGMRGKMQLSTKRRSLFDR